MCLKGSGQSQNKLSEKIKLNILQRDNKTKELNNIALKMSKICLKIWDMDKK